MLITSTQNCVCSKTYPLFGGVLKGAEANKNAIQWEMLMGKWIISFHRSCKLNGQASSNSARKKTDTNERSENQVSTKAHKNKIRAQIDKRPKKRRDENVVGDGKLKTNKENALAFIRYSVDVCWFLWKGPYLTLAHRFLSSGPCICVFKPQRSWDGNWIKAPAIRIQLKPYTQYSSQPHTLHTLPIYGFNKFVLKASHKHQKQSHC